MNFNILLTVVHYQDRFTLKKFLDSHAEIWKKNTTKIDILEFAQKRLT